MVWIMVPAGDPTQKTVDKLAKLLDKGDMIIDGGNSQLDRRQGARRGAEEARASTTSTSARRGGVWGLRGRLLHDGRRPERGGQAPRADPRRARAAADRGARPGLGPLGPDRRGPLREDGPQRRRVRDDAGLRRGLRRCSTSREFELDNAKIAHLWMQGSVVRSWLCELAAQRVRAGRQRPRRRSSRYVDDSGEGRWTVEDGDRQATSPTPVITTSLLRALLLARQTATSPAKVIAALRNQFGGHAVQEGGRDVTRPQPPENPLVEGLERLPVHPTTLVIFGAHRRPGQAQAAAGDLQPRPRGRAARALQPRRLLALGHAPRGLPRRWRPRRSTSSRAASPTTKVLDALLERRPLRAGHVRRPERLRDARQDARRVRRGGRRAAQPRLLPVDRAGVLPGDRRGARRGQAQRRTSERRGALHHREAVRHDARGGPGAQPPRAVGLRRAAGLPHRPLPGQGDRPEHDGVPVRQRACSSRSGTATTIDHVQITAAEDIGDRHARRLLRQRGRAARPRPEPHAAAAVPPGDGAAGRASPPTRSATRRSRCCTRSRRRPRTTSPRWPCARSTPTGTVGGEDVPGYLEEDGRPGGLEHRDLRGAAAGRRQLALGRRAVLPAHRQAAGAQGHRDRGDAQAGPAPRVPAGGLDRRQAQPADPHACSPTRACRSRSGRRSPARGCASAR